MDVRDEFDEGCLAATLRVRLSRGQLRAAQHPERGAGRREGARRWRVAKEVMRAVSACLKTRLHFSLLVCAALVAAQPVSAHHSFAMFDTAKRVTLSGTVTGFEWTNPH